MTSKTTWIFSVLSAVLLHPCVTASSRTLNLSPASLVKVVVPVAVRVLPVLPMLPNLISKCEPSCEANSLTVVGTAGNLTVPADQAAVLCNIQTAGCGYYEFAVDEASADDQIGLYSFMVEDVGVFYVWEVADNASTPAATDITNFGNVVPGSDCTDSCGSDNICSSCRKVNPVHLSNQKDKLYCLVLLNPCHPVVQGRQASQCAPVSVSVSVKSAVGNNCKKEQRKKLTIWIILGIVVAVFGAFSVVLYLLRFCRGRVPHHGQARQFELVAPAPAYYMQHRAWRQ